MQIDTNLFPILKNTQHWNGANEGDLGTTRTTEVHTFGHQKFPVRPTSRPSGGVMAVVGRFVGWLICLAAGL